jgi:1,4-dihydroxy-2-naphthoate octaprenyltransferase
MATAGPPLVAAGSAVGRAEPSSAAFLERVLAGALALLSAAMAVHYANEYADAETDALTVRTPSSGGSGALERTDLPRSFLRGQPTFDRPEIDELLAELNALRAD